MSISIRISESPALARLLRQPGERVRAAGLLAAKRAAETYADAVHDYILARRPFRPRTGATEASVGWRGTNDGALVYAGGLTAPQASWLEFGTRAHVIRPRPGREALRWFPAGGGVMFARGVRHPGTAPRPFFFADATRRRGLMLAAARKGLAERLLT